jgi:hypothetical protein
VQAQHGEFLDYRVIGLDFRLPSVADEIDGGVPTLNDIALRVDFMAA